MLPTLKHFNNREQLIIIGLLRCFSKSSLLREKYYLILLVQIIENQLNKNSTNSVAKYIYFNLNIIF